MQLLTELPQNIEEFKCLPLGGKGVRLCEAFSDSADISPTCIFSPIHLAWLDLSKLSQQLLSS